MCSVDAARVRPFWGRALGWYAAAGAIAACAAVLGAFLALKAVGYRVPLRVVAWPPAWHQIQKARADYYLNMALHALASNQARRGFLALEHAHVLDPDNVGAARLLAYVTRVASPDYSDQIYAQVLAMGGSGREATAETWFRSLLARGDFKAVGRLSARMLREGSAHAPAWTEGVLFAERMGAGPSEVDGLLSGSSAIPAEARFVLSLAVALRSGTAEERRQRAEVALGGGGTPFEVFYALRRLIDLGSAADVAAFLQGNEGAAVEPYDREALKLDAYAQLRWESTERRELSALLVQGSAGPVVTLVSAHLVRHPDAASAQLVFRMLEARPLPATPANAGAHMALLCMAGVNGLAGAMRREAQVLARVIPGSSPAWARATAFFTAQAGRGAPSDVLPYLGELPLELEYALIEHYRPADAPRG